MPFHVQCYCTLTPVVKYNCIMFLLKYKTTHKYIVSTKIVLKPIHHSKHNWMCTEQTIENRPVQSTTLCICLIVIALFSRTILTIAVSCSAIKTCSLPPPRGNLSALQNIQIHYNEWENNSMRALSGALCPFMFSVTVRLLLL